MPVTLGAQQASTTVRPATSSLATSLVKTSFFFEIHPECEASLANFGDRPDEGPPDGSSLFTMSVNRPASIPVRSGTSGGQTLDTDEEPLKAQFRQRARDRFLFRLSRRRGHPPA